MDWRLFTITFATLFMAELGDKTQLAVIMLSSQNHRPLPVFLGASLALVAVTLLGVLGGEAATRLVAPQLLRKLAAGLFVVLGLLMWFDIL